MNKVILLGRLTREPEVKYTQSGKCVAQFTLAVDRPFANQDGQREADFIPVVIWGKPAELVGNTVGKGQRVLVEGRMQVRSYDDKQGNKHYITEVIAERFEYIERREQGGQQQSTSKGKQSAPIGGGMESFGTAVPFDEEIPF